MVGVGRVAAPRAAQNEVWKVHARGVRIKDATLAVGVDYEAAREWVSQAGGIRPRRRPASGRFLSVSEREEIALGLAAGRGVCSIARQLGRSPSMISREIVRNRQRGSSTTGSPKGSYRAVLAQGKAVARARRPKVRKLARDRHLAAWWRSSCSGAGLLNRSLKGSAWSSPMMKACASRMRRSTSRCSGKDAADYASNCTHICSADERCVDRDANWGIAAG